MKHRGPCYACGAPATTTEHVPPRAFFPAEHRRNLITVSSCDEHNNARASDDEYIAISVCLNHSTNAIALKHVQANVLRSVRKNPGVERRLLEGHEPTSIQGLPTVLLRTDRLAFDRVMQCICAALHYKQHQSILSSRLLVVSPQLGNSTDTSTDWTQIRNDISGWNWRQGVRCENPEVFTYAWTAQPLAFWLTFYGGFEVFAFEEPE